MGWRKTQAQVASGAKSFVPKDDSFEQGFAKFADIVSTKMMSDAKAKRDEEKADRDYITEQTRLADEKDKEHQKKATAALEQANLDPTNTKLFNKAFTMAQGGQTIENIFAYFDSGIKAGTIEVIGEKAGPMPGTAINPVIAKYESGSGGANALLNQAQNGQFSDIRVSTMPIGEVMAFQGRRGEGSYHAWSKANMPKNTEAYRSGMGSTPVGTYQFVGDTLQELKRNGTFEALGITDATVFDEQTQEKLFVRYAQDSLKGKTDPAERREALRSKWEGLKNASDEEVDSVIASIETGTFAGADALTEVDRDAPGFDMGADVKFKAPEEEFDNPEFGSVSTYPDWVAMSRSVLAGDQRVSDNWKTQFSAYGQELFTKYLITADVKELNDTLKIDTSLSDVEKNLITDSIEARQTGSWNDVLLPSNLADKTSVEIERLIKVARVDGATEEALTSATSILDEIKSIESEPEFTKFVEKSTSYPNTLKEIANAQDQYRTILEGPDGEAKTKATRIINQLVALSEKQQKGKIAENLGVPGSSVKEAVVTLKDGTQEWKLVVRTADGKYLDSVGKPIEVGSEGEFTFIRDLDAEESKSLHALSVQTNKYTQEALTKKNAIIEGLVNAERALEIARRNPDVRTAAGDVAQFFTNVARGTVGTIGVLNDLFENAPLVDGEKQITEEQFLAAVGDREGGEKLVDAILSGNVQNLGDQTAMFEAQILSLVFRAGRMEGQSGNAMSNKDFDRLKEMLDVKGGIEAFENVLRTFMADKIRIYDQSASDQLEGPVGSFIERYKYSPVKEPLFFKDAVTKTNDDVLTNAYTNTINYVPREVTVTETRKIDNLNSFVNTGSFTTSPSDGTEPIVIKTQDVDNALNSIEEKYKNNPTLLKDARRSFLQDLAKEMGTTYDNLIKLGGYE